jgi:copper chaperone CopZ
MAKVVMKLPTMYADHHVLAVRRILLAQPGVQDVFASSAFFRAEIVYDPSVTSPEQLRQVLAEAGYPEGDAMPLELPRMNGRGDPAWQLLGVRASQTNEADLKMSGEFRKY